MSMCGHQTTGENYRVNAANKCFKDVAKLKHIWGGGGNGDKTRSNSWKIKC